MYQNWNSYYPYQYNNYYGYPNNCGFGYGNFGCCNNWGLLPLLFLFF